MRKTPCQGRGAFLNQKPRLLLLEPFQYKSSVAVLSERFNVQLISVPSELHSLPSDTHGLVVRLKYSISREILNQLPALKFLATPTTGVVHIDLNEVMNRGIRLISLRNEKQLLDNLSGTAELVWGLIFNFFRNIACASSSVKDGYWDRDLFIGSEVRGKTLGIIGFGRLGSMVAEVGAALKMNVIYYDIQKKDHKFGLPVSLEDLLGASDIISIHVHLSDSTRNMISTNQFSKMKRRPLLVNTARGEVVDEDALVSALYSGQVCGACLDVLCGEYWNSDVDKKRWIEDSKLISYAKDNGNLLITPHIGGLVYEGVERAELRLIELILAFREND